MRSPDTPDLIPSVGRPAPVLDFDRRPSPLDRPVPTLRAVREPRRRSFAFVFVCQRGDLEGMALLLAASLRRFVRAEYELIAAIPTPIERWGMPCDTSLRLLSEMGARVEFVENTIGCMTKGDALTNKIFCLRIPTRMDKLVFLDSDVLCMRPFDDENAWDAPLSAAPTFRATGRNWEGVYGAVGLGVPERRMLTLFSNEAQPPYFNSGVVAVDAGLASRLSEEWWETFRRITASGAMADNPYYREQVSLSVSVIKMGLPYRVLGEPYNFWVKARPVDPGNVPLFLHHTWPNPPIYHQPVVRNLVKSLVAPHDGMARVLDGCRWRYYLQPEPIVALHRAAFEMRSRFDKLRKDLPRRIPQKLRKLRNRLVGRPQRWATEVVRRVVP